MLPPWLSWLQHLNLGYFVLEVEVGDRVLITFCLRRINKYILQIAQSMHRIANICRIYNATKKN